MPLPFALPLDWPWLVGLPVACGGGGTRPLPVPSSPPCPQAACSTLPAFLPARPAPAGLRRPHQGGSRAHTGAGDGPGEGDRVGNGLGALRRPAGAHHHAGGCRGPLGGRCAVRRRGLDSGCECASWFMLSLLPVPCLPSPSATAGGVPAAALEDACGGGGRWAAVRNWEQLRLRRQHGRPLLHWTGAALPQPMALALSAAHWPHLQAAISCHCVTPHATLALH